MTNKICPYRENGCNRPNCEGYTLMTCPMPIAQALRQSFEPMQDTERGVTILRPIKSLDGAIAPVFL